MGYGPLERFLVPERIRPHADTQAGHSTPLMQEIVVRSDDAPLLVTSTRGNLVHVPRVKRTARTAYFHCLPSNEGSFLEFIYHDLVKYLGESRKFRSLANALRGVEDAGSHPCAIVIPPTSLGPGVDVAQAQRLMEVAGYVSVADGVYTLLGNLPEGNALVVARQAGHYLRTGDWLALMLLAVDRRFAVVIP
jgi:hypothetical protein